MKLPLMTVIKMGGIVRCPRCREGACLHITATTDAAAVLTKCGQCGYKSSRPLWAEAHFQIPAQPPRRLKLETNPMAQRNQHIQNRGFGVMMPSKNKEGAHPSAPGQYGYAACPCCGEQLKISGWVKTADSGFKFLNLKFEKRTETEEGNGSGVRSQTHTEAPY